MSMIWQKLMDGAAPAGPVVIANTASIGNGSISGSPAGTMTLSSTSIGTADAGRVVVLNITTELNDITSIDSATIDYGTGAQAMTAGVSATNAPVKIHQFYLPAPTGTTATFVISFTMSKANTSSVIHYVSVYKVTGCSSTPASTGSDTSSDMDASDPLTTGSITIPTNGGFLAVVGGSIETDAKTWANATEDLDLDGGNHRHTTAISTTAGTVTVTCTGGTNNERGCLSYIIFNPG
jgi:hypothetical protein